MRSWDIGKLKVRKLEVRSEKLSYESVNQLTC